MGVYSNQLMDLLSKDNAKVRKENELIRGMIDKYLSGKHTKKKLAQEYQYY